MEINTFDYIVKKYNIDVSNHYIIDIPNMGRERGLAQLFEELNFNRGAEIGVENGYYSEELVKANPKLHLYCIDPWSAGAYDGGAHAVDTEQSKYDERHVECVKRLTPYNTTIIRKGSMEALKDFKDNSLDFVYIDANHDFPNFINDIHGWKKKVKVGGIVSGHDYAYQSFKKENHVKRALPAYARSYRWIPLFIIGAEEYKEGTIRDKYRSWMWVRDK